MVIASSAFNNSDSDVDFVKKIYTKFVRHLKYQPLQPIADDNVSYQALQTEFAQYNTGAWFDALCRESASMAELSYSGHSDEVRIQIARYTWFLIYVDDLGQKFPDRLLNFQKALMTENTSPEGHFLKSLRQHLSEYYRMFDPIPANCINLSAMDFINGCLLEQMPKIQEMPLSEAGLSWPYFLHNKTGSAQSYSFMIFPKETGVDMTAYIQVLEDLTLYTNLTNDILSFYKEHLAGERNNYVYNRAYVSGKPVYEALQDVVDDTLKAHDRITKALEFSGNEKALACWRCYVNGYLGFHFTLKRYRLDELNLLE
ncbi:terpenoid synthase [Agrocybe pediades]|nr:terpenoid synthase [Agrocybe pediades]